MIKRIFSVVALLAMVLMLGAGLDSWRDDGVSLVADRLPAIIFDREEK